MGNVGLVNKSNIIVNTALCIITRYYEANKILPGHGGQWDNVGYVWFSVVMVPWDGPGSEFGECSDKYHRYVDKIPDLAKNVSESGSANIGYIRITGSNITKDQAEERLRNLAYWGDGFKVAGYTLTFSGGPPASAVSMDPYVIDISHHFDNIQMSMSKRDEIKEISEKVESNEIR